MLSGYGLNEVLSDWVRELTCSSRFSRRSSGLVTWDILALSTREDSSTSPTLPSVYGVAGESGAGEGGADAITDAMVWASILPALCWSEQWLFPLLLPKNSYAGKRSSVDAAASLEKDFAGIIKNQSEIFQPKDIAINYVLVRVFAERCDL